MQTISDEVKQELIEKYRDINVSHDWWDFCYENFTEEMCSKGIDVDQIFFSGFWSQGDGAVFTGRISYEDFKKFMEVHDLVKDFEWASFFADLNELAVGIRSDHRGYTLETTLHDHTGNPYFEEDGLRYVTYDTMQTLFSEHCVEFEERITDILRGYADKLYRKLEEEYYYLVSDEVVWDTIEANELHLQHEGV